MLIRHFRRPRLVRIDHHEPRALPPRLLDERPQTNIVAMDIRAPRYDHPGMREVLGRRPQLHAIDLFQRHSAGLRADRPLQLRRAQPMEEPPVHRPIPKLPDRPRIRVRQHALRPKLRGNRREPLRNQPQRLIPRHALKRIRLAPFLSGWWSRKSRESGWWSNSGMNPS